MKYKSPYELIKGERGDSGYDVRCIDGDILIKPMETMMIDTGVKVELPSHIEAQVRPKSGKSKNGLLVHFGTVDSGYRGNIKVVVTNLNKKNMNIEHMEKIAQLVFSLKDEVELLKSDDIDENTERGSNGFGSTGRF